jgi:hypothetical protein
MGKSRLVAELCREAAAAGINVLAGSARVAKADAPLHLAVDLLADGLGVRMGDDPAVVRTALGIAARSMPGLDVEALVPAGS